LTEVMIFVVALIAGTACSMTSKVMLEMESVGLSGHLEPFSFPLFQTFGMFVGMLAALVMHIAVKAFKIPFPGYDHKEDEKLPLWMYFLLAIPSVFDLLATAFCMFGMKYVNVSIYQLLRGSAIVFVALLKQFVLKNPLTKFMWVGVLWNVVAIVLVGYAATLAPEAQEDAESPHSGKALLGVTYILIGALVQSLQYAFEERVMSMDISAPPLFLIGMEGLWGCLYCLLILYPLAYYLPGEDHGCIENPYNTYEMIKNSADIQNVFIVYFLTILAYNILACLVTFTLNSVWHAILDNFRPITVWMSSLVIFYFIAPHFGEAWSNHSYIQLVGVAVLLYGTAIYNAPNPGSFKLTGDIWSMGMDFSSEYAELEAIMEEEAQDEEALLSEGGHKFQPMTKTLSFRSVVSSPIVSLTPNGSRRAPRAGGEISMSYQNGRDIKNYGSVNQR
jgi:multidrug transporter EmrE-like cation transporter